MQNIILSVVAVVVLVALFAVLPQTSAAKHTAGGFAQLNSVLAGK
jgi:hypothetical protein